MRKNAMRQGICIPVLLMIVIGQVWAATGDRDRSFGNAGIVTAQFDTSNHVLKSIAVQTDGRIVAGGECSPSVANQRDFCIARFMPNGTPDTTFGSGGKITVNLGTNGDFLEKLLIQTDGKILAIGYKDDGNLINPKNEFMVIRYNADGTPDSSFGGGDGIVTTSFGNQRERALDAVLQPDGKLVVSGTGSLTGAPAGSTFGVARYNTDGSLDTSFDSDGFVVVEGLIFGLARSILLQPDGKIVLAGDYGNSGNNDYAFVRLQSNGQLDATFDGDGKLTFSMTGHDSMHSAALLPDGKVLAMGLSDRISLIRLNANGSFDTTFNGDGRLLSEVEGTHTAGGLAIQPDGKFLISGNILGNNSIPYLMTARYLNDGTPDPQYGTGGTRLDTAAHGDTVVMQKDGKILIGGSVYTTQINSNIFFLARYLNNGTRESDFDYDRKADISVFRPDSGSWYLSRSSSGFSAVQFGATGDRITPGDYDGDGKIDIAIFRNGLWFILKSSDNTIAGGVFGANGDLPVTADYDADGKADLAVFRQGVWYITNSNDGSVRIEQFGLAGDKPVTGNFDGDLRSDLAVYRNGAWYINGSSAGFSGIQFGLSSDRPVPADYDGDGATDIAVFRDGAWYILQSHAGFTAFSFGLAGDIPAPADFDGDGQADRTVYRNGAWYVQTETGGASVINFGLAGDIPVPSAYLF